MISDGTQIDTDTCVALIPTGKISFKDRLYIFTWLESSADATPAVMLSQAVICMTHRIGW